METTNNKQLQYHSNVKVIKWTSIVFTVIVVSFLCWLWSSLDNNITEIKNQNKSNYKSIASLEKLSSIEIEVAPHNKKHVLIEPAEINKINQYINSLVNEVQNEKNRTDTLIDKDLSRLGTYMAVGIGFMTLLGVFIPVFINILSVQDMREKQKNIEIEFNTIKNSFAKLKKSEPNIAKALSDSKIAFESANEALIKSNELAGFSEKVDLIESKTFNISLSLCNFELQNTIARFFNISPIVISNAARNKDYSYFIELLRHISDSFDKCKADENHKIMDNGHFTNTVNDFILFLNVEQFRFQGTFDKEINREIDQLTNCLQNLLTSSSEAEFNNYESLNKQFNLLITKFTDKNVKNQPAA